MLEAWQEGAPPAETGKTTVHKVERRDPRAERIQELSDQFEPDAEPPF